MQEMQETQVRSLGQEDPLEEKMATHSSILTLEIPWTEEPGGIESRGLQGVEHNRATKHNSIHTHTHTHTHSFLNTVYWKDYSISIEFSKMILAIYMWVSFWATYSLPSWYVSVFIAITKLFFFYLCVLSWITSCLLNSSLSFLFYLFRAALHDMGSFPWSEVEPARTALKACCLSHWAT